MSRPYRIVVQKVVETEVSAADRSTVTLALDDVAGEDQLEGLLIAALERNDWHEVAPGVYEKERGEETLACDVAARQVTTTLQVRRTLRDEVRKELRGDTFNWREMREMTDAELARIKQNAEDELTNTVSQRQQERATAGLQDEVAERLQAGEDERRQEINRLVVEVTADALKQKAQELGTVQQLDERWDGDAYELVISVQE